MSVDQACLQECQALGQNVIFYLLVHTLYLFLAMVTTNVFLFFWDHQKLILTSTKVCKLRCHEKVHLQEKNYIWKDFRSVEV